MHFHNTFGKTLSSYKLFFKFFNFSIFKILPIFRDIYQNRFLKKHKNEIFRKLNDGILILYLGQNAYYMNRKNIVFYNDRPI